MGARTMRRTLAKPDPVHRAFQQNVLLGAFTNSEARRCQRSRKACHQIHQNYEAFAKNQQLQFVLGIVVRAGFSTNSSSRMA